MGSRGVRWLAGLALMLAVGLVVIWVLDAVGVPRWLAVVIGILAAASLEPTSYARRGLARMRDR